MRAGQITGSVVKLAVLVACVYGVMQWQAAESRDGGVRAFAENACADEIHARFDVSSVNVYNVQETSNGYSVRASATLSRGTPVKIVCLANPHGGIRDLEIDQR